MGPLSDPQIRVPPVVKEKIEKIPHRNHTFLAYSSYLRPTLSSSLKSRTQSPAKVKEHSSGRSRGTPTKANGANNTPSTSTTRKIKKPEMFMSELEKFLSHCIVKKSDQTNFNDVIGQEKAKGALNEMVVLPAEVS